MNRVFEKEYYVRHYEVSGVEWEPVGSDKKHIRVSFHDHTHLEILADAPTADMLFDAFLNNEPVAFRLERKGAD